MNDTTPSTTSAQIAALQLQVFSLLVALIVVSGTLTVFLYRQASIAGKDYAAIQPQAEQIKTAYAQNQSLMVGFVNALVAYGQTHPEYRPVLQKYGIAPVPGVPAGAPAAAAPAAPKK
jgi:hypothetical protein